MDKKMNYRHRKKYKEKNEKEKFWTMRSTKKFLPNYSKTRLSEEDAFHELQKNKKAL